MKLTENWPGNISRSLIVFILTVIAAGSTGVPVWAQEPAPAAPVSPIDVSKIEIGGVEKLDRGPYTSFVWSPDGAKALVSKTRAGHQLHQSQREGALPVEGLWVGVRDLWVVDWPSGQEEKLVETAHQWAWSPDGSAVAYIVPMNETGVLGELSVIDLATKSLRRIAEVDLVQSFEQPVWLQTNEIVYVTNGRLWSVQPDGSDLHQLNDLHLNHIVPEGSEELAPYNGDVRGFAISSTGKYIAYHKTVGVPDSRPGYRAELWLSDLDGQNARVIDENGVEKTWSPDGRFLLYSSQPDWENPHAWNLAVVDAETGQERLLHEAPALITVRTGIVWSPGSDAVAFREELDYEEESSILWFIKADSSEHKTFQDVEVIQSSTAFVTWAKDGTYLLVIPRETGIPWRLWLVATS